MDLKNFIDKWQKKANKRYNEGKYKEMCHINPKPWFDEVENIEMVLNDLKAVAEPTGGLKANDIIPLVSQRSELLAFCKRLNEWGIALPNDIAECCIDEHIKANCG